MKRVLAPATVAVFAIFPALAGDLSIRVGGVSSSEGRLAVAVCTEAEFLKTCRLASSVAARPGAVTVRIPVPPGRYAIQAFHDKDGDGRLKTNVLGIPTEPIGFSRDARMRFGPPRYEDAVIEVGPTAQNVPVTLRGD